MSARGAGVIVTLGLHSLHTQPAAAAATATLQMNVGSQEAKDRYSHVAYLGDTKMAPGA